MLTGIMHLPAAVSSSTIGLSNLPSGRSENQVHAEGNFFQDNDFGTKTSTPTIIPTNIAVDEGGNVCQKTDYSKSPLTCVSL